MVYYTALDSIGGFGVARTIIHTKDMEATGALTPDQVKGVAAVIDKTWSDPWVGGVHSFISPTGSWAVFVATVCLGIALLIAKKAPWPPPAPARCVRLGAADESHHAARADRVQPVDRCDAVDALCQEARVVDSLKAAASVSKQSASAAAIGAWWLSCERAGRGRYCADMTDAH